MTSPQDPKLSPEQFAIVSAIIVKMAELGQELSFKHPVSVGPLITTYRFEPKSATKVNAISSLTQDIALTLGVEDVLIARIPGESVIGITVPNRDRTTVLWRDSKFNSMVEQVLPINFGVDSLGRPFVDDLVKMPHLLIAGSTGGGKTVLLDSIIATIMYVRRPDEVQFVLSDTKQVEFGHFIGAPHLLHDPVTTMYQTWEKMDWLHEESMRRLTLLARAGKQNALQYNKDISKVEKPLPYIILVIDELADILGGGGRGEGKMADAKLSRIIQKSRASGIHVIAATQRPSVDVVSGSIKANFPARLSFRLPSEADSRTVLGSTGAEHLLARGDMLYLSPTRPVLTRLHSAYASIEDMKGAVTQATLAHLVKQERQ